MLSSVLRSDICYSKFGAVSVIGSMERAIDENKNKRQDRNRCVLNWIELNTGAVKHSEVQVYTELWRLGASVARGFGNVLESNELDDCIHDVMVRISQDENILDYEYPAAYFTRGVKHSCLSKLRARRNDRHDQPAQFEDGEAWEAGLVAEQASLDLLFEHADCMRQVLNQLTPEQTANLELALDIRVHGMAAEDVAQASGRSARAVTQAVSNFVKVTLRKLIEEVCPGMVQQVTGRVG